MTEKQFLKAVRSDIKKRGRQALANFKKRLASMADKDGIIDFGTTSTDAKTKLNTMVTIHLYDNELKVLIAALDARDRYLAGIARRQLDYKPTETRNRKLESIETERRVVETVKFRALGELQYSERNRSIEQPAAAPAQNESKS